MTTREEKRLTTGTTRNRGPKLDEQVRAWIEYIKKHGVAMVVAVLVAGAALAGTSEYWARLILSANGQGQAEEIATLKATLAATERERDGLRGSLADVERERDGLRGSLADALRELSQRNLEIGRTTSEWCEAARQFGIDALQALQGRGWTETRDGQVRELGRLGAPGDVLAAASNVHGNGSLDRFWPAVSRYCD